MSLITSLYTGNYAFYAAAAGNRPGVAYFPGPMPPHMPMPFPMLPDYNMNAAAAAAAAAAATSGSMAPFPLMPGQAGRAKIKLVPDQNTSPKPGLPNNNTNKSPNQLTKFTIDEILGRKDSSSPKISPVDSDSCSDSERGDGTDTDRPETDRCTEGGMDEGSDPNTRFSWLQCTRYKPPKLPRVKRKDGVKKRKLGRNPRVPFTQHQVTMLEQKFRRTHYLSSVDVAELSAALNLTETRVKIWFQNRRARERRDRESNIQQQPGTQHPQQQRPATAPSTAVTARLGLPAPSPGTPTHPALAWSLPTPPNPSALAHFSHALQHGTSAFTPVSYHQGYP